MDMEGQNYRFFSHRDCEYFPCHETGDPENFNCLFCYCPLYVLGEHCGGNCVFTESGTKDCSRCLIPHKPEGYDYVLERYCQIAELAKKKD